MYKWRTEDTYMTESAYRKKTYRGLFIEELLRTMSHIDTVFLNIYLYRYICISMTFLHPSARPRGSSQWGSSYCTYNPWTDVSEHGLHSKVTNQLLIIYFYYYYYYTNNIYKMKWYYTNLASSIGLCDLNWEYLSYFDWFSIINTQTSSFMTI